MDWQVDFTNMPRVKRHKYLLVLVDTFSGWVEAFPTFNKRATTVASIIVTHIIPWFGMPTSFQSDNGPEFTSQITQTIIKALNIPWQFHIPYHPSSSGKVEHSNCTLKEVLIKLNLELHLYWVQLLPIALFHLRVEYSLLS
jgi:transposase InsO family protein